MTADPSAWGIVGFLIILLIGIACVSVHYRRKYEELKIELNQTTKQNENKTM